MFHSDNTFLIKTFKEEIKPLSDNLINTSKENGSYYDFFLKDKETIVIPENINFSFKYLNLLKEHSPEYFSNLQISWKKYIPSELYNILQYENDIKKSIDKLTQSLDTNYFGVLPPEIKITKNFREYKNLERLAKVNLDNPIELNLFRKMYQKKIKVCINSIPLFIYPVNISSFYRIRKTLKGKELVLVYPKWNAYRWSTELPNFIISEEGSKIKYFLNKKETSHQEIIDLQMGL